jgi:RNA polymerase sigma-70 factor (ECF subfamily)
VYEPDSEVIRAAAAGDTAAFEELVHAYQAHVWRFLRHLLGDPTQAEDVTQETFIRIYRKLGTFRFRSKFSTWVFQVARNAGIDALRARGRRERLLKAVERRSSPSVPANVLRLEIEAALQSLTPKLREAFVLVEALGFTYREAGTTLGVPEGTVKSRVFHAREQLVSWLTAGEGIADEV